MKQYTKPIIQSEEEYEKTQMKEWLADSHYWVETNNTYVCKWCGKATTTSLDRDAYLCNENPVVKELIKK